MAQNIFIRYNILHFLDCNASIDSFSPPDKERRLDSGLDIFQEGGNGFSVENLDPELRPVRKFEVTYLKM